MEDIREQIRLGKVPEYLKDKLGWSGDVEVIFKEEDDKIDDQIVVLKISKITDEMGRLRNTRRKTTIRLPKKCICQR